MASPLILRPLFTWQHTSSPNYPGFEIEISQVIFLVLIFNHSVATYSALAGTHVWCFNLDLNFDLFIAIARHFVRNFDRNCKTYHSSVYVKGTSWVHNQCLFYVGEQLNIYHHHTQKKSTIFRPTMNQTHLNNDDDISN